MIAFRWLVAHCPGARGDRRDDVVIPSASTDVAFELFPDRRLVQIVDACRDIDCHHHHPGRAVAALERVVPSESGLHWMERSTGWRQSLDGGDRRAFALQREHRARLHCLSIHIHDTGAALRRFAPDVRAGQAETFPQKVNEQRPSVNGGAHGATVYHHRYVRHPFTLCAWGRVHSERPRTNDLNRIPLARDEWRATPALESWASECLARQVAPARPEPH